jgi:DNA-directed RNA polymerase subunit M/transcription elongation factor TFIIS
MFGRKYCQKCKSLIYPQDERDWQATGLCYNCAAKAERDARRAEEAAEARRPTAEEYHLVTKMPWED